MAKRWPGAARMFRAMLVLFAGLPAAIPAVDPGADSEREKFHAVIAGYVVVCARNVTWPDGAIPPGAPLRIGVLRSAPFWQALETGLAGRTIGGRPVAAVQAQSAAALAGCQVIFAGNPSLVELDELLETTGGRPILTIVLSESRAVRGGIIELFVFKEGVRYTLNSHELRRSGLIPSPELLEFARRVAPR